MFGLSPLLLSFLGVRCFSRPDGSFNSAGYLGSLAILTLIVNAIGLFGLQRKDGFELILAPSTHGHDERSPLIQTSPPLPTQYAQPKLATRTERDPEGMASFLASPTVWLLGLAVLFSVGPAEMTIASIGAVADAQNPDLGTVFKARQVQLISITNTFCRLLSGWLSDRWCGSSWGLRLVIWGFACLCYLTACFSVAMNGGIIWVLSTVTGCCYGIISLWHRAWWLLSGQSNSLDETTALFLTSLRQGASCLRSFSGCFLSRVIPIQSTGSIECLVFLSWPRSS